MTGDDPAARHPKSDASLRNSMNMMLAWQKELSALETVTVDGVAEQWHALAERRISLTPTGKDNLQRLIKKPYWKQLISG